MNRVDIEEAPNPSPPSFWQANKKIITIVATIGAVLVVTGVVLAIVLSTSGSSPETSLSTPSTTAPTAAVTTTTTTSEPTTTTTTTTTTRNYVYERLNSRIDCLPWLRNRTEPDEIEAECALNAACEYQDVDENVKIPSCYYDLDKLRMTFLSAEPTRLGQTFTGFINSGPNLTETTSLKIDFEYLEDTVLRFKVILNTIFVGIGLFRHYVESIESI